MKIKKDIIYAGTQLLNVYLPDDESYSSVFVYFHGGGIESGDKSSADVLATYLTEHSTAVVSANYRMYPDHSYPDFLYDAAAAVRWAKDNMNTNTIYVGGSSAGGYISMMLCFDKKYYEGAGIKPSDIAGYVHDAGQPTAHFNVLKYKEIDPRRVIIDESAPIYHVGLSEEYPRMLFIVSDNDMQNRYEQTILMVSTLKHFGHEENVSLKLMHGNHCSYVNQVDNDNDSILGKIIYSFIVE